MSALDDIDAKIKTAIRYLEEAESKEQEAEAAYDEAREERIERQDKVDRLEKERDIIAAGES